MEFLDGLLAVIPMWFVGLILAVLAVYWYMTNDNDYWAKIGVPYIPPVPLIGSAAKLLFKPMHDTELERYMEKGRVYGSFEGVSPVLYVGDPDLLRDILVKDFQYFTSRRRQVTGIPIASKMVSALTGEDWKRVRTLITPAFTTAKIKRMSSIFTDSSKTVAENFRKAAESGKPIECKSYFGAFTMDVIASSAFGTKIDSHSDPNNIFVSTVRSVFRGNTQWRVALILMCPIILKIFKIPMFPPGAMEFFKNVTLQIVKERREKNKTRNDFLQLMMDCVKEESEEAKVEDHTKEAKEYDTKAMAHEENNADIFKPAYITKSMSEDELVAQCVIFFFAGFETTVSTLSFTAYELALNPEVQEKLIAEIDECIRKKGELTYDAVCEMKYLEKVLSETLRKYPPSIRTDRQADSDYVLRGIDIKIPKDMLIAIPIYAIHHDPLNYPDPEKYDPERFSKDQKESRHAYTYLPFGAGPRNCVAMRFALMEIKFCLVNMLKQFRFKTCPETKIPLNYFPGQGLMQAKEITIKVEIRTDAVQPIS